MNKIDAYIIQQELKKIDFVSVPWIQMTYNLDYRLAKMFLNCLISNEWIGKVADGNKYPVLKDNLCLRKISKFEVEMLCKENTLSSVRVLKTIRNKPGITESMMLTEMRGESEEKLRKAIEILMKHRLVYACDDRYYVCISKKTIDVLAEVVNEICFLTIDDSGEFNRKEFEVLIKKFDVLFDET